MNEETARDTGGVFSISPIELVKDGMEVVDAAGEKVGKVEYLKMGDPQAVTTAGEEHEAGGLIGRVAQTVFPDETEPDVPQPLRAQLMRNGFIKVDGPGLLDTDRYVRADLIESVSGDRVILRVRKDQLPRED